MEQPGANGEKPTCASSQLSRSIYEIPEVDAPAKRLAARRSQHENGHVKPLAQA
jgi:hypothetical protein